jgi:hypothetical protein
MNTLIESITVFIVGGIGFTLFPHFVMHIVVIAIPTGIVYRLVKSLAMASTCSRKYSQG